MRSSRRRDKLCMLATCDSSLKEQLSLAKDGLRQGMHNTGMKCNRATERCVLAKLCGRLTCGGQLLLFHQIKAAQEIDAALCSSCPLHFLTSSYCSKSRLVPWQEDSMCSVQPTRANPARQKDSTFLRT